MEENLVLKLRDFSITKLEVLARTKPVWKICSRHQYERNPSFQKEYYRTQEKSGCAIKIVISAFIFLANNNVGTETWFLWLSKNQNFNHVHIQSQIIGHRYRFSKLEEFIWLYGFKWTAEIKRVINYRKIWSLFNGYENSYLLVIHCLK